MKWSKLSHVGLVRKNNEDNCCVCDDIQFLAVADGMGGHKAGEIASKLALEALVSYLRENSDALDKKPIETLNLAFQHTNKAVFTYAQKDDEKFHGMGTTITAVLVRDTNIYIAHVGDSRAYLVKENKIKLLTNDHSLVNELVKRGGLTQEEAENHPQRNVLTRAIGTSPDVETDISVESVNKDDVIILCTDGLSNLVNLKEIKKMVDEKEPLNEKAKHLIERALDLGGMDNITVVLYQIG